MYICTYAYTTCEYTCICPKSTLERNICNICLSMCAYIHTSGGLLGESWGILESYWSTAAEIRYDYIFCDSFVLFFLYCDFMCCVAYTDFCVSCVFCVFCFVCFVLCLLCCVVSLVHLCCMSSFYWGHVGVFAMPPVTKTVFWDLGCVRACMYICVHMSM